MDMLINPFVKFHYAGLFTSEQSWIHPKRTEKTYEIIYAVSGSIYMCVGEDEMLIRPGQLILLEPNVTHYGSRETKHVSFYWLHFSVSANALPFEARFFESFNSSYLFRELLHYNNLPDRPEHAVSSLLIRILSELRYISENSERRQVRLADEIYEWIRINANAELCVTDVAAHFSLSPDHVSRILSSSYKKGCKAIIDMFVLKRAMELLCNTNMYIKEIAYELGFCSSDAFNAFFKYRAQMYPGTYRKKFIKTHMNSK